MQPRWLTGLAVAAYLASALALMLARPGLQYDEALMALGAVHMRHSGEELPLPHDPDTWVCPGGSCFPLMTVRYVGALREYLTLAAFSATGGPKTFTVRFVAALLAALCVWGVGRFTGRWVAPGAGAAAALVLAVNPSFADQTVFDNGAIATWMGMLGLAAVFAARYLERGRVLDAAFTGAFLGLGVWARANFLWFAMALAAGFALPLWTWMRRTPKHAAAAALGCVTGMLPFIAYQAVSGFGTLEAVGMFQATESGGRVLASRAMMWAESLISNREHRAIWGGGALPSWQAGLFAAIVVGAIIASLRSRWRGAALALLVYYAMIFASGLQVAEHHMVTALPLVAVAAAIAGQMLWSRAKPVVAAVALAYFGFALYWQWAAVAGIRATGGKGQWSDAIFEVARDLEAKHRGREIRAVDWGLQNNIYLVSDGRVRTREIFSLTDLAAWQQETTGGGLFLLNGPDATHMKQARAQFLQAAGERAVNPAKRFHEKTGAVYAELYDLPNDWVEPARHLGSTIRLADPAQGENLTGFHQIENNAFRWTRRRFAVGLTSTGNQNWLSVDLFVPDQLIAAVGPVTLKAFLGEDELTAETFSKAGRFTYQRPVKPRTGSVTARFEVDKALHEGGELRELGLVLTEVRLQAK